MKRLFVIPILFVYLVAMSGIMISIHYCGRQMESWNVFSDNKGCADDSCKDEKNDGCCKDKVVSVKISDDQNFTSLFKIKLAPAVLAADISSPVFTEPQLHYNSATARAYMPNAPPGIWQNIPLYKLHSRFTYYG